MPKLTTKEFNTPEYWGKGGNIPGGYGDYQGKRPHDDWLERAQTLIRNYGLSGKVLELGCAMGSWVEAMRRTGLEAYGLDLPWPIDFALANLWPELEPCLVKADARDYLSSSVRRKGEWDFIVSWNFLECLSDKDLRLVVPKLDYVAKDQIHIIDPRADGEFYNRKTLAEWRELVGGVVLDGC